MGGTGRRRVPHTSLICRESRSVAVPTEEEDEVVLATAGEELALAAAPGTRVTTVRCPFVRGEGAEPVLPCSPASLGAALAPPCAGRALPGSQSSGSGAPAPPSPRTPLPCTSAGRGARCAATESQEHRGLRPRSPGDFLGENASGLNMAGPCGRGTNTAWAGRGRGSLWVRPRDGRARRPCDRRLLPSLLSGENLPPQNRVAPSRRPQRGPLGPGLPVGVPGTSSTHHPVPAGCHVPAPRAMPPRAPLPGCSSAAFPSW